GRRRGRRLQLRLRILAQVSEHDGREDGFCERSQGRVFCEWGRSLQPLGTHVLRGSVSVVEEGLSARRRSAAQLRFFVPLVPCDGLPFGGALVPARLGGVGW